MAKHLKDTICGMDADRLYGMVESGWNVTLASLELKRRGLPATRKVTKPKRQKGTASFRAKGHTRVTGGAVDLVGFATLPRMRPLPGKPVEPWNMR